MGRILIIGVGSAGANTVNHMKDIGIHNADYITMGDYQDAISDIPHYNLIEMSGIESLPNGASAEHWKTCAEQAKDSISEIIESYIKRKS